MLRAYFARGEPELRFYLGKVKFQSWEDDILTEPSTQELTRQSIRYYP